MPFTPSDASRFARLAIALMSNKSTPAQIRFAGREADTATLPPSDHARRLLVDLVVRAKALPDNGKVHNLHMLAERGYEVGMDLLLNVQSFAARADLEAAVASAQARLGPAKVKAHEIRTHVANHHAFDRFAMRRDLHDADEIAAREVAPDDAPLPYAQRQALAKLANESDEAAETDRALDYLSDPP
ncbi:hypothetical protein PQU92_08135 [Asticcacaulis sp. BYS171W]|uniref:Uncharacterized protein n=1 Tax=Asticcacaulis aquaticus TaxID=2984212 RepID=A0ABT5HTH2_9CAUL|nr:hypothetical protein [Asticcacaulis aquaticus]MDC7683242.1 hypothetical protein [Asticcacaulis aquaticus]